MHTRLYVINASNNYVHTKFNMSTVRMYVGVSSVIDLMVNVVI